ncbi:hypothetical protein C5Y96_07580 [Blastopirellula marina]|uniref:HEAT repeat domain-containing protein n=1 Tax=Blastopirellula marina TaxID=124 RepID=A0A2S8FXV7_9BACT|nr:MULTISPECIES: hypothetical protein [Pirellulaceae]PQO37011.1 hypothetical protein C5Y96_07580 [Blastopirellula marina]RCS53726.1 hypothetical protein DTL36_07590 [Bremerella cremea]
MTEDPIADELRSLDRSDASRKTEVAAKTLKAALTHSSNRIVQRAAEMIADAELVSLTADLVKAYWRLKRNPLKKDPGCLGKTTIIKALVQLELADMEVFRDGITYRQLEPHWKGEIDTAAELRGVCAIGLVHFTPEIEVLNRCAVLLCDAWPDARLGAAQALGALGQIAAAPLLRLKLLTGDRQAEVHGECCSALLKSDREEGLAFVQQFLTSPDADQCVQTALALGETRQPGTFDILRSVWGRRSELSVRESLLLCIGLLRTTESQEFLLLLIDKRDIRTAADSVKALRLNGPIGDLRERTEAAVQATESDELLRVFRDEWLN